MGHPVGRRGRRARARPPVRLPSHDPCGYYYKGVIYVSCIRMGQKIHTHTTDRPRVFDHRLVHYVYVTRTHARFDPIRHGNTSRCRARPFIHSFIHSRNARDADARRETRTRHVDRSNPSFVRSHRFVRIDSSTSRRRTSLERDRVARSPIRPLVRRVERANRRSRVRRSSDLVRARARDVASLERVESTERLDFHSCIRSRARRGRDADDDDDDATRARRDRSTRATSRRRRRGLGSTDAGVGDLTSRDSWTCGAGHTHDPCVDLRA